MKFKAIVTDLDGTAVNSPESKVATERLAKSVRKLDGLGVKVCAATGRALSFANIMFRSMHLTDPAIVSSGARIVDPVTEKELWLCSLETTQTKEIIDILKQFNYGFLWNDSTEDDYLSGGWSLDAFDVFDSTYFLEVCFVPQSEIDHIVDELKTVDGIAVTVVIAQRPNTCDIHITNTKATKEHAIYQLQKMIGVDKSAIIGIGDGHNDTHLFSAVGYKVAMENSVTELKDQADKIIGHVKDDGLAIYFEELAKEIENEV